MWWSDCVDVQAILHLCCLHMQSAGFLKTGLKMLLIMFLARAMNAILMFSTCIYDRKYLN